MKRSKFSLSHSRLMSCDMGELVPISWLEVLPGDTIQHATNCLVRAAPLLAPVMHRVDVRIHHFFVPFRLVWEDWEDFITGGPDNDDTSIWPYRDLNGYTNPAGSLVDHLGIASATYPATSNRVSALPIRAYNLIWNEYYRDQDLQTPLTIETQSGVDTSSLALQNINWEKDYLTSARPWEQKGPTITIPLGTDAPVVPSGAGVSPIFDSLGGAVQNRKLQFKTADSDVTWSGAPAGVNVDAVWDTPNLKTDLSGASAVTINVLREALALERYAENRARFGSRYVEYLRYLGVRSSDARLQRPEYLGGGRQTIQFSEVLQTAVPNSGSTVVGQLRGHGITGVRSNRYRRFFEEHGMVLSLFSVRPKTIYRQGIPKKFLRETKEDVWQQELQHIGQQMVQNREAYGAAASPKGQFGFQDRYDEYRRQESSVAGEFGTSTLNYWHMAREFASEPALNSDFVTCTPTERTFAVPSQDVIYVMANHSIQARRLVAQTGRSFIF